MTEATYVSHRVMPMIEGSLPDRVLESLVNIARLRCVDVQNRPQPVENFQR
jgi:hypothetical protein